MRERIFATCLRRCGGMITSEKMPGAAVDRDKCADCEYKNYCADVF